MDFKTDKSIGLIIYRELPNHLSYYESITKLFNSFNINIYCSYPYNDNGLSFDSNKINVVYRNREESLFKYYGRISASLKNLEIVILEEHSGNYVSLLWLIFTTKSQIMLTIHNVNSWVKLTYNRGLTILIKSIIKRLIIEKVAGCIVVSSNVKNYVVDNNLIKNIFMIPFVSINISDFKNGKFLNNNNKRFTIVIPGNVSSKRRDYNTILDTFEELKKELPELKLVLLGRLIKEDERKIYERINTINSKNANDISYWTTYIEQNLFEEEISKANVLIGNVNIEYSGNDNIEYYGQSKETGILFLMLKYKKITLVPEQYEVPKLLSSIMLKYGTDKSMYSVVLDLITKRYNPEIDYKALNNYIVKMSEDSLEIVNKIKLRN